MGAKTGIEWTEATWNPLAGCSIVSAGCNNCYAMKQAHRMEHDLKQPKFAGTTVEVNGNKVWTGKVNLWPKALGQPLRWRTGRRIFVNSMSDLFHEDVPREYIAAVFGVMLVCPDHIFQVLTKREQRMSEVVNSLTAYECLEAAYIRLEPSDRPVFTRAECAMQKRWHAPDPQGGQYMYWLRDFGDAVILTAPNIWLGMTMEDQPNWDRRISFLRATPAAVRWVSIEPQIGPINVRDGIRHGDIHWLVIGGESSQNKLARPFHFEWAKDILDVAREYGVACFMKQKGNNPYWHGEPVHLCAHHGADPAEWPEWCRVREYPTQGAIA